VLVGKIAGAGVALARTAVLAGVLVTTTARVGTWVVAGMVLVG
jgi:hypothetical protein